jgi:trans-aconitate 2-methyltransferase
MSPRDWNATSYERMSAPLEAMGRDVLDRLDLRGDERVLDAGCGTGRVTAALLERLPRGEVVAVDGSSAMVEAARRRLGDAVELRVADLLELELDRPVDAILSTATFHWIADHDRLFARLHAVLKPGGRLVAQCGGAGNIAELKAAAERVGEREPFAPALAGWPGPWNFARRPRPRTGCAPPASPTSGPGRTTSAWSPTTRASTSGRSRSARTSSASSASSASHPSSATPSWTP